MVAKVVGLVLLAVIAGALLWSAGEQHYQGCVQVRATAALARAVAYEPRQAFGDPGPRPISLSGCSRWPF